MTRRAVINPGTVPKQSLRPNVQDLCRPGEILKSRWEIISKLGAGGFGQIYIAKDTRLNNVQVAIKVEYAKKEKAQLPMELYILRNYQGFPHAVQVYGAGTHNLINFIAMQLVGHNLAKLRRLMKEPQKFTLSTTMRLAIQCFEAIRDLHSLGAIHRDVKPSNFAMGLSTSINKNNVYILDFGLSKFHVDLAGNLIPPKGEQTFQGTLRYCSIATHLHEDIGRKDDLVSYFYMIIEFVSGSLPWRDLTNAREVLKYKEKYSFTRLAAENLVEFHDFAIHLNNLKFADKPNYKAVLALFHNIVQRYAINMNGVWDWDNHELCIANRSSRRN